MSASLMFFFNRRGLLTANEKQHLVEMLTRSSAGGLAVSVICASVLIFGFLDQANADTKIIWYVLFCLAAVARMASILFWHKQSSSKTYDVSTHLQHIMIGVCSIGVLWGAYALILVPSISNDIELAATIAIYTGVAAGASSTLAGNKVLSGTFVCLLMLPMSGALMLNPKEYAFLIGCLCVSFSVVITISGARAADVTLSSVKIRYENTQLIEQLAQRNETISQANSLLETRVKERTEKIYQLSNIDPLTSLSNRSAFSTQLKQLMVASEKSMQPFALYFIDLDGFKAINDVHGHDIGDYVLSTVAQRLKGLGKQHDLLCRWGGDEFLVSTTYISDSQVINVGNAIISAMSHPIMTKAGSLSVSATVGVSLFPEHGRSESELIAHADIAMYQQKHQSKGYVKLFSTDMQEKIKRQAFIKDSLTNAIVNNEFYLVFQPVVDIENHSILFAEALIRWQKGAESIAPSEFIVIAEKFGFIQNIGLWAAEQVAKELVSYPNNTNLCVSINMSIAQLMQSNIATSFSALFESYSVAPNRIYIEVTETLLNTDTAMLIKNLNALKDAGFNIAIDDFGTGYSSLSQLQNIAPKIVKIDKSFVDDWTSGGEAIIEAMATISKKMAFDMVLEGVEHKEQVSQAQGAKVTLLQGYFFAKPMSMAKLQSWQAENQSVETK
jgi:diguanylate cyclase (GGDEF)-like protein